MSNPDHVLSPCTIIRTIKEGYMIETSTKVLIVPRSDVVPTPYGWGLILRGEKAAGGGDD